MERNYDSKDLLIVPVKALQAGDTIRDFHSAAPTYGTVRRVEQNSAVVLWDGEESYHTLRFKGTYGQRADIIRLRRLGEVSTVEPLSDVDRHHKTMTTKNLVLSDAAFFYLHALVSVDAGENAPTSEVHKEVLMAFGVAF